MMGFIKVLIVCNMNPRGAGINTTQGLVLGCVSSSAQG